MSLGGVRFERRKQEKVCSFIVIFIYLFIYLFISLGTCRVQAMEFWGPQAGRIGGDGNLVKWNLPRQGAMDGSMTWSELRRVTKAVGGAHTETLNPLPLAALLPCPHCPTGLSLPHSSARPFSLSLPPATRVFDHARDKADTTAAKRRWGAAKVPDPDPNPDPGDSLHSRSQIISNSSNPNLDADTGDT